MILSRCDFCGETTPYGGHVGERSIIAECRGRMFEQLTELRQALKAADNALKDRVIAEHDRNRRIVAVGWRVETPDGSMGLGFEDHTVAREYAKLAGKPVRHVIVRRKAKP